MIKISIISPVYNSSKILKTLIEKIVLNIQKITRSYEIILIDDCSSDNSWNELKKMKKNYKKLKIYKNKKNIGQHPTIRRCLKKSKGKIVFVIDCDLQDDPVYFKKFYDAYKKSNNAIFGKIKDNSFNKGFVSFLYWHLFSISTGIEYNYKITNYSILTRSLILKLLRIKKIGFLFSDIIKTKEKVSFIYFKRKKSLREKSSYN